jgi:hypothetical protein
MYIFASFLTLILLYILNGIRRRFFIYLLLNKSESLYVDEGNSKLLRDSQYLLTAKPDRIVRYKGKVYVVEFKSRKTKIFKKDIVQASIGALASWDFVGQVDFVLVYNGRYRFKKVKVKSKSILYDKYSRYVKNARDIKKGLYVSGWIRKESCFVCPYVNTCKFRKK